MLQNNTTSMASFKLGLKDSITFGVAFVFLYLSIGFLGASKDLTLFQTLSTSLFVFSTPLQFLMIQNHTDGWLLIPIVLAMNARFLLMSGTLAPYFKKVSSWVILPTLILIVPSVFSACLGRFRQSEQYPFYYFLGVGIPIFVVSVFCTYVGFTSGTNLSSPTLLEIMTILLPLQFTALAAKHWPHLFEVGGYWAGFIFTPLLVYWFGRYNLILTPFLVGLSLVALENFLRSKE